MLKVAIILGSTRPERNGEAVAHWVHELAQKRTDAEFELIDLAEAGLPFLDEPLPASQGKYAHEHSKAWSARIDGFDAFVFVAAEYNHGISAALKNAIDFLYMEWNNKAAGFVGYGSLGAARAVEHLRMVMAEVQVATVRAQVALSLSTDFKDMREFTPADRHTKDLDTMLDQLVAWGEAMRSVRRVLKPGIEATSTAEASMHPTDQSSANSDTRQTKGTMSSPEQAKKPGAAPRTDKPFAKPAARPSAQPSYRPDDGTGGTYEKEGGAQPRGNEMPGIEELDGDEEQRSRPAPSRH